MTEVSIPVGRHTIEGDLILPENDKSAVIFAHGSGSSRHSPRNKYVAEVLNRAGLATLLIDLLTPEEELVDIRTAEYRFNSDLPADRLIAAHDWSAKDPSTASMAIGDSGSGTRR